MKQYKWTITGLILALLLWGSISWQKIDVFESVAAFLQRFEFCELDELFFPLLLFYTLAMTDLMRRQQTLQVETARLTIYRKMVKAVYHIMNNFLLKMMAFKMAAEKTPNFDPEALKLYDQIIDEADEQIQVLGSLEKPDEELIEQAITPARPKS